MTNEPNDGLLTDASQITRCVWCGEDAEYQRYHDTEWGVPIVDDQILFQKICLEGFQAGLSWITVLRKRDNFRKSFDNFDFKKVANMVVRIFLAVSLILESLDIAGRSKVQLITRRKPWIL